MDGALDQTLKKFLENVPGLIGIVISSTESVCFGQAWKDEENGNTNASAVATSFPIVVEQVSKLQWGGLKKLSAFYDSKTFVSIHVAPLLIFTFVGNKDLDVDMLTSKNMYERLESGFQALQVN